MMLLSIFIFAAGVATTSYLIHFGTKYLKYSINLRRVLDTTYQSTPS